MKTKRTPLQWVGFTMAVLVSVILALLPAGAYGTLWVFIPKTFWPVFLTATIGGILFAAIQVIWVLTVLLWWDTPPYDTQVGGVGGIGYGTMPGHSTKP